MALFAEETRVQILLSNSISKGQDIICITLSIKEFLNNLRSPFIFDSRKFYKMKEKIGGEIQQIQKVIKINTGSE